MAAPMQDYVKVTEGLDALNFDWEKQVVLVADKEPRAAYAVPREYLVEEALAVQPMLDAQTTDEEKQAGVILSDIDGETLAHVVDFLKYHEEKPMRPIQPPLRKAWHELVNEWDRNFVTKTLMGATDEDNVKLLLVANAALFLNLECLKDLTTSYYATTLIDKPVWKLRRLMHVTEEERHPRALEEEMLKEFTDLFPEKKELFALEPPQ
jgi:hypothetical protein